MDNKAARATSLSTAALGATIGLVRLLSPDSEMQDFVQSCEFIVMALLFFLVLMGSLYVVSVRTWKNHPDLKDLHDYLPKYTQQQMLKWTANQYARAVRENDRKMKWKARVLLGAQVSLVLMLISAVLFVVASVV